MTKRDRVIARIIVALFFGSAMLTGVATQGFTNVAPGTGTMIFGALSMIAFIYCGIKIGERHDPR